MADPDSIEDFLSSEIDEYAVNALVGSLESQLASPTNKEPPRTLSDSVVNNNHVDNTSTNSTSASSLPLFSQNLTNVGAGHKIVSQHNNSALNSPINSDVKVHTTGSQIIGISSIDSHLTSAGGTHHVNVNTVNAVRGNVVISNKAPNTPHTVHIMGPQHNNAISTGVPNALINAGRYINNIANSDVHTVTANSVTSSNQNVTLGAISGSTASHTMHNLASIASEQKPIKNSHNGSPHQQPVVYQIKQEPSNVHLNKNDSAPNSPFVMKREVKQEHSLNNMTQSSSPGHILPVVTQIGQMVNTTMKQPGSTNPSVITVRAQAPHQQVTVVRPPQTQIVNLSTVSPAGPRPPGGAYAKTGQRVVTPIRIAAHQPQISIAPRQPGATSNTITIPSGFQLPPGTLLMRNEQGQLMLVSTTNQGGAGPHSATKIQAVRATTTQQTSRPTAGQTIMTVQQGQPRQHQPNVLQHSTPVGAPHPTSSPHNIQLVGTPQAVTTSASQMGQLPLPVFENVKKCKNFLSTLIKLASSQPPETVRNVRDLIQGLIDGKVEPEMFTERLQVELKSSPQPYLVPFLKKSLPLLRQCLLNNKMTIEGVRAPPPEVLNQMQHQAIQPVPSSLQQQMQPAQRLPIPHNIQVKTKVGGQAISSSPHIQIRPGSKSVALHSSPQAMQPLQRNKQNIVGSIPSTVNAAVQGHMGAVKVEGSPVSAHKDKRKFESLKDDDDINDVATMGGVNLSEESKNILATNAEFIGTQIRSCKDETFLYHGPLFNRIHSIAKKYGIDEISPDVVNIISHATQERLRDVTEKLSTIAEHRIEMYKVDPRYEVTSDTRSQLKFIEELDKLEKKRHEEQEREILLRAIKSRSKNEDPEQLKLKQKAKELQAAEMEEMRQREANMTALAAIGPRKKRKLEVPGQGSDSSTSPVANGPGSSSLRPSMSRPRIKRANLRDLIFLLEQERSSTKSNILYKTFLK
ncbi:transcription initiation factor TFIID subunit 4-like [Gigantopelta aegis]|uniref:transcription initiation factor TFIID subunit 4-like n=1 Tax=Gigantopelta aegis TaxID=1735272 RepID=UPI001B88C2EE|nr:transcription initiation factor TFIID subunit 4-like [Gigantopelta aegis]